MMDPNTAFAMLQFPETYVCLGTTMLKCLKRLGK